MQTLRCTESHYFLFAHENIKKLPSKVSYFVKIEEIFSYCPAFPQHAAQNPLIKDSNAGAVMAWMGVDTLTYIIATVVVSADSAQGKMTKFRFPALSSP